MRFPIPGYEGKYSITDYGEVMNVKNGKVLKQHLNNRDYFKVALSKGGIRKSFFVHRLIIDAFDGILPGLEVDHIDGNTHNNNYSNLRQIKHDKNVKDGYNRALKKCLEKVWT